MSENVVETIIYGTLAQIAEKEKLKAIKEGDYGTAFFVGIFEGIFREAEISSKQN